MCVFDLFTALMSLMQKAVVRGWKCTPYALIWKKWLPKAHEEVCFGGHFFGVFFQASFGEFTQKSFASPKILPALTLVIDVTVFVSVDNKWWIPAWNASCIKSVVARKTRLPLPGSFMSPFFLLWIGACRRMQQQHSGILVEWCHAINAISTNWIYYCDMIFLDLA